MKNILFIVFLSISINAKVNYENMNIGANALYWEETDRVRSKPDYIATLKKLNIQSMRFPGGEVADNYDWRTNTLNDPQIFPYSRNSYDPIDRMDFNEFMRLQKKLGSEPIIVVNLENGFVTGDLEGAAKLAADWVKYANIEMGYNVKYWEIGNESYQVQTRYSLSAEEYAKAFNLFAKKMKAIDPTIKVGANGPFNVNATAIFDKLTVENQKKIRAVKKLRQRKKLSTKLLKNQHSTHQRMWWKTIFNLCKNNLDFVVLHHYIKTRHTNQDMKKPLVIKNYLRRFNHYMKKQLNTNLPIFITEWNIYKYNKLSKENLRKTIIDAKKQFQESNVHTITFWPLRKMRNTTFGLIDIYNKKD